MSATLPPRLQLTIDQSQDTGYTPIIQPGQDIIGTVKITTDSAIQVLHLRAVFFGHVQVHGDKPNSPLTNGIFDCLKDLQLVNTGVRIARRPSVVDTTNYPIAESSKDAMKRPPPPPPSPSSAKAPSMKQPSILSNSSNFTVISNDSNSNNNNNKKSTKSPLDKETEKLIRQIATKPDSQDTLVCPALASFDYPPSHVYTLENKSHRVRYRLSTTVSLLLPGSFNHRHCPIQYYAISIMLCKDLKTGTHYVTYARLPLRFDPIVNVLSTTYAGILRETDRLWLGNDTFLNRLLNSSQRYRLKHRNAMMYKNYSNPSFVSMSSSSTSSSSSSSSNSLAINNNNERGIISSSNMTDTGNRMMSPPLSFLSDWWYRLVHHHHAWLPLDRPSSKYSKALDCTLELPRRAFCRGQALPFSVKLVNGAGIRIAMVTIEMKLVRRIGMTCSVGETVSSDIDFQASSIFYGDEVDAPRTQDEQQQQPQPLSRMTTHQGFSPTPPSTPPLKPDERKVSASFSPTSTTSSSSASAGARQPFFLFTTREMHFDLSPVATIPQHCPCTIMSELTRHTFELVYEWEAIVKVLEARHGPRLDASLDEHGDQVTKYYATTVPSSCGLPSSDYRTHVLTPPKMNIVIGNR